jgi:hypothetical protein
MTDARLPERWLNDRRLLRLSDRDFRTYVMTLLWSVSNRTDGAVEADDLDLVRGAEAASVGALEAAGLWRHDDAGRWSITDYAATQTSRHELEVLDNHRRREREKKARQRGQRAGTVPGDSPEGTSPGTAKARTGKDRTGSVLGESPESTADDDWPEVTSPGASRERRCEACGFPLDPAISVAVHPTCEGVA